MKREKHGMAHTLEYRIWGAMKGRCHNQKASRYKDYGGRGITVCERWRESFSAFIGDMGPRPTPKHSIDRIENSKGYEPSNCRWATPEVQSQNRERCFLTYNGEKKPIREWIEQFGITMRIFNIRRAAGMSLDQVFAPSTPRDERWKPRKLNQEKADAIRSDSREYAEICSDYGISKSMVWAIKSGKSWAANSPLARRAAA